MPSEANTLDAEVIAELAPELEVLRPLGSGESANVYLAREPSLQRLVALKILKSDVAANPTARQRFEREAQSAARITHANVTAIYRVGRLSNDVPYMVLEYVDGRTVQDIIEAGTTFDYRYARTMLASVSSALAAAHDRGIVHRDVRPGNVYVENRTARAVLGDFGIAALLESGASSASRLTAAGVRLGETRYMSPEQIRGEQVTEQSDVYAFGILAYEVLTGRGPYDAKGEAQMMTAHLQGEPLRLRNLRADVDIAVATMIERCLAKDPNRRPRAQEITEALNATSASSPAGVAAAAAAAAAAADAGPVAQLMAELQRRRVYQVAVAYVAFALALFGVAQGIDQAFPISHRTNQIMVLGILGGFPVAITLSWVYDIRAGSVRRTRSVEGTAGSRWLMWVGLAVTIAIVGVLGWLLMQRR